jgi:hypothetical protein
VLELYKKGATQQSIMVAQNHPDKQNPQNRFFKGEKQDSKTVTLQRALTMLVEGRGIMQRRCDGLSQILYASRLQCSVQFVVVLNYTQNS